MKVKKWKSMSNSPKPVARPKLLSFQKLLPSKKQYGERLRLRIVDGETNIGKSYILLGDRILIGRADDCDLPVEDINVSRRHAELLWADEKYSIHDLESANGVIVNQKRVQKAALEPKDVFKIGGTIFEVINVGKQSQVFLPKRASTRASKKIIEKEDELRKNKVIIGASLGILLLLALSSASSVLTFREKAHVSFVDEEKPIKKISRKKGKALLKETALVNEDDSEAYRKAELFYKEGIRELNNENFQRAIDKFEVATTLYPKHALANIYLSAAKTRLEKKARDIYKDAIQARRTLRYKEAKMHYGNVIRLLQKDSKNKLYMDAKEALEKLEELVQKNKI